jgi:hypothetical protein
MFTVNKLISRSLSSVFLHPTTLSGVTSHRRAPTPETQGVISPDLSWIIRSRCCGLQMSSVRRSSGKFDHDLIAVEGGLRACVATRCAYGRCRRGSCWPKLFDHRLYLSDSSERDSITTLFRRVSDVGLGYTPELRSMNRCQRRSSFAPRLNLAACRWR